MASLHFGESNLQWLPKPSCFPLKKHISRTFHSEYSAEHSAKAPPPCGLTPGWVAVAGVGLAVAWRPILHCGHIGGVIQPGLLCVTGSSNGGRRGLGRECPSGGACAAVGTAILGAPLPVLGQAVMGDALAAAMRAVEGSQHRLLLGHVRAA